MVGAGNVASHLAPAISLSGSGDIVQVFSRQMERASELAKSIDGCEAVDSFDRITSDADIFLISVADDAIWDVASSLPKVEGALYLHTSGSVGMEVLACASSRYGVFYPLQTFSRGVDLDIASIPLFIEGVTQDVEDDIRAFATPVFRSVYHADSERRKKMHIAAVFACNFTNFLWSIAADLLEREDLPFDVLQPLLEETLRKAFANSPSKSQTGPAARGDRGIVRMHIDMLSGIEKEVYSMLSSSIMSDKAPR